MSERVRLFYEKRGGACFVPHVALATLFARSARRAGIELRSTDGFSPHAKMSFGPELPAGVVALSEPVDVWIREKIEAEDLVTRWSAQMPEGFRITGSLFPAEDAPALGKVCKAAHYWIWSRDWSAMPELLSRLKSHYGEDVLQAELANCEQDGRERISFLVAGPARNGIGGWVKALVAEGIVAGWQDLCIVRVALGQWDGERMKPLTEEGIACLQM